MSKESFYRKLCCLALPDRGLAVVYVRTAYRNNGGLWQTPGWSRLFVPGLWRQVGTDFPLRERCAPFSAIAFSQHRYIHKNVLSLSALAGNRFGDCEAPGGAARRPREFATIADVTGRPRGVGELVYSSTLRSKCDDASLHVWHAHLTNTTLGVS